jgi:hypothetical protein
MLAIVIIRLTAESILMARQAYAPPIKCHALHPQTKPLFERKLAGRANSASRADYAVPGQIVKRLQRARHLPGASFQTRRLGYLAIGRHLTAWNLPNESGENA